jgi:hypothetical protein
MKTLAPYILPIFTSFFLASCSLSFAGLVALDNSLNAGPKKVGAKEISTVKNGTKVTVNKIDSTSISGTLSSTPEDKKSERITIENDSHKLENIKFDEINNITYVDKGGNVFTAIAIGAAMDAIIIYVMSSSKHTGFGGATKIF